MTFSLYYFTNQNNNYWKSKHLQPSLVPSAFLWYAVSVSKLANDCEIGWDGESWRKQYECSFNMFSYATLNPSWYQLWKSKMNPKKSETGNLILFFFFPKKNIRHLLRKTTVPANIQVYLPFATEHLIKTLHPPFIWQKFLGKCCSCFWPSKFIWTNAITIFLERKSFPPLFK